MSVALSNASIAQIKAAEPEYSTWLSANAGSGKTRVLTDRVARLLLSGVDPQNILCLTYTKAAASEMQNRLFGRLGQWAMKPDPELEEELETLGVDHGYDPEFLARARRLFAQAVETPGGLRIQTIHSFCASLLRRFPREAGVSIGFKELDERSAAQLRERVADDISQGPSREIFLKMAHLLGGSDLTEFTAEIVSKKAFFSKDLNTADANKLFGLQEDTTEESILKSVFLGGELEFLTKVCALLKSGGTQDQKVSIRLLNITGPNLDALRILEGCLLFGSSAKEAYCARIGKFPSQTSLKLVPDLEEFVPELEALMLRVEDARSKRISYAAAKATQTLNAFGRAFLARYDEIKSARGLLDFDDQILQTKALLTDPAVAQWVLYRLDGGIDHILVDEAQDTSPDQWAVVEQLAQEITSGQGAADDKSRTIFVVGDKKQSIYSFQGADASEFERMREAFDSKLANHANPLQNQSLAFSFRSSKAILSLVDEVFKASGDAGFDADEPHEAFHTELPGRVDLWQPIVASDGPEEKAWYDPVDMLPPSDPVEQLAEKIADQIKRMIETKTLIPTHQKDGEWQARPVHEGDFLILLQRRQELFHAIIRACKRAKLEIAGADRLKINDELAVKDITALLSFLATPEDDLSLAAALRSPLFGWSEQELFSLAAHRGKGYLWQTLRTAKADHPQTLEILTDLRTQADFLRPYELIERMLTRHQGRKRIAERLGHEAEDALDAFLGLALEYEQSNVPSLTGFLSWLDSDNPEVKRQVEAAGQRIRVMTVHGSKGLEAPIVIMPETQNRTSTVRSKIISDKKNAFLNSASADRPDIIENAVSAKQKALEAERDRLLYVAMTRAEKWLIVAAAGETDEGKSWYHAISKAADALGAEEVREYGHSFRRVSTGLWPTDGIASDVASAGISAILEPFFSLPAQTPAIPQKPISASKLEGAKALSGDGGQSSEDAKRFGTKVHLLLENLPLHPKSVWADIADGLLQPLKFEAENAQALAEASSVIEAPELSELFSPAALSEVALSAPSSRLGLRIHGIVDKLVVEAGRISVFDFKSNAVVPAKPEECPKGILAQMGAYVDALEQIYPEREIISAIVWTRNASLMTLPHDLVMNAYKTTTYLDVPPTET